MTSHPGDDLSGALALIGRDPEMRERFLGACRAVEALPGHDRTAVRETLTGPLVDALHRDSDVLSKELANGLVFEFLYRSKIARDFVLAIPERPDHVWEPQTTKLLLHLARGADHVVVGGAYFGDQAILLADAIAAHGGTVHAFEPDGDQAATLTRNAERNGLPNVRVNTLGLWDDDRARLRLEGEDAVAPSVPTPTDAGSFGATTLDTYLDGLGVADVDLIVLDIEGSELTALRGAHRRLVLPAPRAPHLVFEVHGSYVDWSHGLAATEILRHLADLGYRAYAVRDFQSNYDLGGRPIELVPPETAHLDGPPHGFNVLATKDARLIETGPFVVSPGVSPKLLRHGDPALHHPTGGL